MKPRLAVRSSLGLLLLLVTGLVQAEPWLAVRMGLKCGTCHESPTGGGLRSAFGNIFAQSQMPARTVDPGEGGPWTGAVSRHLSVGADLRAAATATRVPGEATLNEFELQELRVYLQLNALPNRLSVTVDQRLAPGSSDNLEAYGRLWFAGRKGYLKAGQFYLPFGLRLEDDSAFVRQASGINMTTPDRGLELGWESTWWTAQLAVSNGTAGAPEQDDGKQWSLRAEHVRNRWRLGGSVNFNQSDSGDRQLLGIHAGLRTGPVAWLAEADRISDDGFPGGRRVLWAGLLEANWSFARGQNLKASFEAFEPDDDVAEDEQARVSLIWEYTPLPFVQLRVGARVYDGIPQNELQNRRVFIAELHAFF
jgi:hypothetical protein